MKIVICTDLEGPSGINGRSDGIGNKTLNTPVACQVLTDEVNACIRGLLAAGADDIVVWDGHGGSNSIDITRLHHAASLFTTGGDLAPCTVVDASCDALVLLGYHAMAGVADGYMNHSYDSHHVCNMWLNDELIGEIGINAYLAAYFHVPTIMLSGDLAACREGEAFLPGIQTVATKKALSRYTVLNLNPSEVQSELEATAELALKCLPSIPCIPMPNEIDFKIQFMCPNNVIGYLKQGWEQLGPATIRTTGTDFVDVYSRYIGWAPGVHNARFNVTPAWRGLVF